MLYSLHGLQVMGITDPAEFQRIAREYCKDMASEISMPYYLRQVIPYYLRYIGYALPPQVGQALLPQVGYALLPQVGYFLLPQQVMLNFLMQVSPTTSGMLGRLCLTVSGYYLGYRLCFAASVRLCLTNSGRLCLTNSGRLSLTTSGYPLLPQVFFPTSGSLCLPTSDRSCFASSGIVYALLFQEGCYVLPPHLAKVYALPTVIQQGINNLRYHMICCNISTALHVFLSTITFSYNPPR